MSKGIIIVLIIVVLLLAGYIWRDELPWLHQTYEGFNLPELPRPTSNTGTGASNVAFYRWQDSNGIWQYDTRPPEDGRPYERVLIDPDTNLIPGDHPPNQ